MTALGQRLNLLVQEPPPHNGSHKSSLLIFTNQQDYTLLELLTSNLVPKSWRNDLPTFKLHQSVTEIVPIYSGPAAADISYVFLLQPIILHRFWCFKFNILAHAYAYRRRTLTRCGFVQVSFLIRHPLALITCPQTQLLLSTKSALFGRSMSCASFLKQG